MRRDPGIAEVTSVWNKDPSLQNKKDIAVPTFSWDRRRQNNEEGGEDGEEEEDIPALPIAKPRIRKTTKPDR